MRPLLNKFTNRGAALSALLIFLILTLGFFLRLYHIEFGLPQSFRADEPELVEPAIFYAFQIRSIIANNDFYKLIPISYVYGTFPAYLFTILIMVASKIHNLLNIQFPKENMYLLIRIFHAFLSLGIVIIGAWLYKKVFKNHEGVLFSLLFLSLNWMLIVHGHYANADLIVTFLLTASFIPFYSYFKKEGPDTLLTVLTAILFGLAVGTKITSLLALPFYLYIFVHKKDYRNLFAFILIILATFLFTNPFALVFSDNFLLRVLEMVTKESGIALDSVDYNPFKYVLALFYISTFVIAELSFVGIFKKLREKDELPYHIFLIGQIVIYLLFFSLGSRRVDRWLLPILPIIILYASYGLYKINQKLSRPLAVLLTTIAIAVVVYFPATLLGQFRREVPKSETYYWMQENIDPLSTKLVITEEGLDAMNKLGAVTLIQYPVYTSEGAQFFAPPDPKLFDYVVISSRPMENFKRPEVKKEFPFYVEKLENFENMLLDPENFKLIKSFTLPKPNLIPLSDVFIYENVTK